LGDLNVERAEKVVGLLSELMDNPGLKSKEEGQLSELPSKQLLLRAVAKMQVTIKMAQREVIAAKSKVDEATEDEEKERVKAEKEVVSKGIHEKELQAHQEEEQKRVDKEEWEVELKRMLEEQQSDFNDENEKKAADLSERLLAARKEEEQKIQVDTEQQLIAASGIFEKDILKARRDLEKGTQAATKAKSKIAALEADYSAEFGPMKRAS
jgi:hypothetical protein